MADNFNRLKEMLVIITPFLGSEDQLESILSKQKKLILESVTEVSKKSEKSYLQISVSQTSEKNQDLLKSI